jgi:hypothetical protein
MVTVVLFTLSLDILLIIAFAGAKHIYLERYFTQKICTREKKEKISVSDGKGLSQPACPREWKKCEEKNR